MMEKYLFLARSVNGTVQINNSSDSTSLKIVLNDSKYENPVVYMARDVMISMLANSLQGP